MTQRARLAAQASAAAGRAIRQIEAKNRDREDRASVDHKAQRLAFHDLLDAHAPQILHGIELESAGGNRVFHPGTIRGFAKHCDALFGIGAGGYSHFMLNEWLFNRDLKHMFHAEPGGAIRW
mgnify:CR=1 FL=1